MKPKPEPEEFTVYILDTNKLSPFAIEELDKIWEISGFFMARIQKKSYSKVTEAIETIQDQEL